MSKFQKLVNFMKSRCQAVASAFDARDFFAFSGLFLLGYGLYQIKPYLAYISMGAILLYMGLFHGSLTAFLISRSNRP